MEFYLVFPQRAILRAFIRWSYEQFRRQIINYRFSLNSFFFRYNIKGVHELIESVNILNYVYYSSTRFRALVIIMIILLEILFTGVVFSCLPLDLLKMNIMKLLLYFIILQQNNFLMHVLFYKTVLYFFIFVSQSPTRNTIYRSVQSCHESPLFFLCLSEPLTPST